MTIDSHRAAFGLAAAGAIAGLPIPFYVQISRDSDLSRATLMIQFHDDDREGVDRWAAWLGLPRPAMTLSPMHAADRWFQPYESSATHPTTGRQVWVKAHVTVPAPVSLDRAEAAR